MKRIVTTLSAAALLTALLVVALGALGKTSATTPSDFPNPIKDTPQTSTKTPETAVLAGGCFWGVEAVFERLTGVSDVVSGYAGGSRATAHYDIVSMGTTGHAESVQITYDSSQITYGQLLKVFFAVAHDPTELNRQGPDDGTQYRSSIFFTSEAQKQVALAYIQQLDAARLFRRKIVTTVVALDGFYPAEAYHQNFLEHHPTYPYIVYNDLPKLKRLEQQFPEMIKHTSTR